MGGPVSVHDSAITQRSIALLDLPVTFNLEKVVGTDPQSITAGADGQTMWVTEPGAHAVASVSQGGVVQQHSLAGINVTGTLGTIAGMYAPHNCPACSPNCNITLIGDLCRAA